MSDFVTWLRGLAEKGGKGVVNNIDARCLGRVADDITMLRAERDAADDVARTAQAYVGAMEEKLATAVRLLDGLLGLELGSGQAALTFVERYRADVGTPPHD